MSNDAEENVIKPSYLDESAAIGIDDGHDALEVDFTLKKR
jgi:hypothetical protein